MYSNIMYYGYGLKFQIDEPIQLLWCGAQRWTLRCTYAETSDGIRNILYCCTFYVKLTPPQHHMLDASVAEVHTVAVLAVAGGLI